ncbi:BMC domain-containing protein [Hathewaya histolytica]|uniref:Microcompartments family protein n=1 Tax=Hathewaya histolytica TaxID=1498 RepID=A0A4U9RLQ4_HATHI|nr:BMC domain-containing protein [Hathewaya histolytica]VTQ91583.1 microcompartments family protein [Hathewaya histolytica]
MQALGLIETKGLLASIEAADAMVKSADVSIIEKTYVGGGLVTILVTGDVGAVKASIEAGVAAVKMLDDEFLVSEHIIPRPHDELKGIIGPKNPPEGSSSNKNAVCEDNVENIGSLEAVETIENTEDIETEENLRDIQKAETVEEVKNKIEENQDSIDEDLDKLDKLDLENLHKEDVDNLVSKNGIEKTILVLSELKVAKLRNLAREYEDFVIKGRTISKADKNLLITKFKLYYDKN